MAEYLEFEVQGLTSDEAASLRAALATEEGIDVAPPPDVQAEDFGLVAVIVIAAAGAVAALVRIIGDQIERGRGGQIIDLTGDKVAFRRGGDELQFGLVAILAKDGTVKIEVHEPTSALKEVFGQLAEIAISLGKASIDAIAAAAKEKVAGKATVTTETVA